MKHIKLDLKTKESYCDYQWTFIDPYTYSHDVVCRKNGYGQYFAKVKESFSLKEESFCLYFYVNYKEDKGVKSEKLWDITSIHAKTKSGI